MPLANEFLVTDNL